MLFVCTLRVTDRVTLWYVLFYSDCLLIVLKVESTIMRRAAADPCSEATACSWVVKLFPSLLFTSKSGVGKGYWAMHPPHVCAMRRACYPRGSPLVHTLVYDVSVLGVLYCESENHCIRTASSLSHPRFTIYQVIYSCVHDYLACYYLAPCSCTWLWLVQYSCHYPWLLIISSPFFQQGRSGVTKRGSSECMGGMPYDSGTQQSMDTQYKMQGLIIASRELTPCVWAKLSRDYAVCLCGWCNISSHGTWLDGKHICIISTFLGISSWLSR